MTTKSRVRTTVELNPGDKERLQQIALSLGIYNPTSPVTDRVGSISQLMQAIASGYIICSINPLPMSPSASTVPERNKI